MKPISPATFLPGPTPNTVRAHDKVLTVPESYERSKRLHTKVLGLEMVSEVYRAERDSYKLDLRLPDGV